MPDPVATNIIVFGRGLVADGSGFRLTQASSERVDALLAYINCNSDIFRSQHGKVVFSGGWAGASEGLERPPERFCEGTLMLDQARAADIAGHDLSRYAEVYSEIESDSTLENALRTWEAGYFANISFTARNPLGLVAHKEHLVRIDYLIRKVFGIQRRAVAHIIAPGADKAGSGLPESFMLFGTRMAFIAARDNRALRRRHRALVAFNRRLQSYR